MKVLIVNPYRLGDNILSIPALRKYKNITNNYIGYAIWSGYANSLIHQNIPYIDQIHYLSHPIIRRHFVDPEIKSVIRKECSYINGYDKVIIFDINNYDIHIMDRFADQLNIELEKKEKYTEFIYNEEQAEFLTSKINYEFVYCQAETSTRKKDIPRHFVETIYPNIPVIYKNKYKTPLFIDAHIMKKAKYRVLTDSVMYHIACALKLDGTLFINNKFKKNYVYPLENNIIIKNINNKYAFNKMF